MSAEILNEIVCCLDAIGFCVVAIVSDMDSTNQGIWKELGVSIEKTSFPNPTDDKKSIFVFADVPHLIKLLRNHFLDTGFIWNGAIVD